MAGGQFERGLVEGAPTKLTVPYDVAKAMFIEGNQQAAMQAGGAPTAEQQAFQAKITELTA